MYHSVGSSSKRVVTIQFPELQIVVDFDNRVKDEDGYIYPSIIVFSKFDQGQVEKYLDSFFSQSSMDDILNAILVDDWTDSYWLENASSKDLIRGRSFVTTFVNLGSLEQTE